MDRASFQRQLAKGFDDELAQATLSPGTTAVHQLTSEAEHPEYRYLRQERPAHCAAVSAAVAAEFSMCALLNPSASNSLITVKAVDVINRAAAGAAYIVRTGLTAGIVWDAFIQGFLSDLRYGPATTVKSTGVVAVDSEAVAHGSLIARLAVPATDTRQAIGPWVLAPGTFLLIQHGTVNLECVTTFRWWERAAEPGELQGAGV